MFLLAKQAIRDSFTTVDNRKLILSVARAVFRAGAGTLGRLTLLYSLGRLLSETFVDLMRRTVIELTLRVSLKVSLIC